MTERPVIAEPGVYDIDADVYHSHASLSSSGARAILPPSTPAAFRYGVRTQKTAWDMGHAAHLRVLGEGPELVEVKARDWRTKAAQTARDEAYARGAVPLLTEQIRTVDAMADAVRRHPLASRLLTPGDGVAERSLFWRDEETGVMLRCRPDWLTSRWCVDYKSTTCAENTAFAKSAYSYGYYIQAPFYLAGLAALGTPREAFMFIAQEKTPPYLVNVVQLDDEAMAAGAAQMRRAINLYAQCMADGDWPGYPLDVPTLALPHWAMRELEDA